MKSRLVALAAMTAFAHSAAAEVVSPALAQTRERLNAYRSTAQVGSWTCSKRGPGLSHAQVKRMARKRRNVMRNRRAHRRSRA
jgi:hypothetical protein